MLEIGLAVIGVLYGFSKVVSIIRSILYVEENLVKLAKRPVSDREATLFDHVFSSHSVPIKRCTEQACAGL